MSKRCTGGLSHWWVIDFGCKGGGEGCILEHFYTILRSTRCDVEGLNIEVGAKNRGGGLAPLRPLTLTTVVS